MHNVFSKVKNIVIAATDYNSATLSGAVDVVAVQHEDGSYRSTPFHVRFGKFQVLRSRRKPVKIFVNDVEVPLMMKLGSEGAAYFVQESDDPIDNTDYITSPLASPVSSPEISPCSSPRSEPDSAVNTFDLGDSAEEALHRRSMSEGELTENLLDGETAPSKGSLSTFFSSDSESTPSRPVALNNNSVIGDDPEGKINTPNKAVPAPSKTLSQPSELSTPRPWSSFNTNEDVADFIYPPNLPVVKMTVRKTYEHTIAISSAFQVVVWSFTTQVLFSLIFFVLVALSSSDYDFGIAIIIVM